MRAARICGTVAFELMLPDALPEDVQRLLRAYIESYEQLAVLLHVQGEPDREKTAQELASSVHLSPQLAQSALKDLCATGLLTIESRGSLLCYRYAAAGRIAAAVARLAVEYADNPARVIKFLNASAIERVRNSALRAFADAFVLNKKGRDDG